MEKRYEDINLAVLRHIGTGNKILDVGCGSGSLGGELRKRRNYVAGIDVSKNAGDIAKDKIDEFILGDITESRTISWPR